MAGVKMGPPDAMGGAEDLEPSQLC